MSSATEQESPAAGGTSATSRPWWPPAIVATVVAMVDQLTKIWAVATLDDGPRHLIGPLELRLTRNSGGAFSTWQGGTPVLAGLAVVIAIVLVRSVKRAGSGVLGYALASILGGAIGNLIDRFVRAPGVLRGHVIDFIRVPHWPTFNIADSAITVGAVVLVLWTWRAERRSRG